MDRSITEIELLIESEIALSIANLMVIWFKNSFAKLYPVMFEKFSCMPICCGTIIFYMISTAFCKSLAAFYLYPNS